MATLAENTHRARRSTSDQDLLAEVVALRARVAELEEAPPLADPQGRQRAEQYLDVAAGIMVAVDVGGRVTYANRRACAVLGVERDELLGAPWIDRFVRERDRAEGRARLSDAMQGGPALDGHYVSHVVSSSGEARIVRWRSAIVRDDAGEPVGVFGSGEDISEEQRALDELAASEAKFRAIFEGSNVGMGLADLRGRITDTNRALQDILGYSEHELAAMTVSECIHPEDRERVGELYREAAEGRSEGTHGVTRYIRKDGETVWAARTGSAVRTRQGDLIGLAGVMVDVTERRRDEQALQEHRSRLQLVNEIARVVRAGMPPNQIVSAAVDIIAREFPHLRVSYGTIDEDALLTMAHSAGNSDMRSIAGMSVSLAAAVDYIAALRRYDPVIVADVLDDPLLAPLAENIVAGGTRAVLDVPVHHAAGLVGLLCFDAPDARAWSDHEIATLTEAADFLAIALQDAATQQQLAGKTRLIESFERLERVLLSTLDLDEILDTLAREVVETGVFQSLIVALVDEADGFVEVVRSVMRRSDTEELVAAPEGILGRRYDLAGPNIAAEVARVGHLQTVLGWDSRVDGELLSPDAPPETQVAYIIPLVAGDRVLGVLVTSSGVSERAETLRNIDAMSSLLGQAAVALDHARAYEQIRAQEESVRRIVAGARCLLWHADVAWPAERAGGRGRLEWDIQELDESAAREFISLATDEYESYWQAFIHSTPPEHRHRMGITAEEALLGGASRYTQEYPCVDRDGVERWILEEAFVEARAQHRWRLVGVCTDITDRKRREEEVRDVNADLERLVEARTADLTAVNHALQEELVRHEQTETSLRRTESDRQRLVERILTVQEAERADIARELHDQAGQALSSLLVGLQSLRGMADPAEAERHIDALRVTTGRVLNEIRTLSFSLRPPSLDEFGLVAALERDVETLRRQFSANFDFVADDAVPADLREDVEVAVYRVVHSALTNALQHADARNLSVLLRVRGEDLHVIVEDDGVGFDVEAVLAGPVEGRFGLLAMQERLRPVGGTVQFESAPKDGSTVFLAIPLDPAS